MYLTLCERIVCSQFVWATTAILSAVYFIRNPGYVSFVGIYIVTRSIDILQTAVRESSVRRFKSLYNVEVQEPPVEEPQVPPVEEPVDQELEEPHIDQQEQIQEQVAHEISMGYLKGKPWSSWSHNELIKMLRYEEKSVDEISNILIRSKVAIYCRIYKIIREHMDENNISLEEASQWLHPHIPHEIMNKDFKDCLSEM